MSVRDLTAWRKSRAAALADGLPQFPDFRHELDHLFGDTLPGFMGPFTDETGNSIIPARIDVSETDEEIEITADMPGMTEKDIDITLQHNVLSLKGERKSEREDKARNFTRIERSFGKFVRRIALPTEVQAEDINAEFANGVLKIHLPKSHEVKSKTRKIEVRSA